MVKYCKLLQNIANYCIYRCAHICKVMSKRPSVFACAVRISLLTPTPAHTHTQTRTDLLHYPWAFNVSRADSLTESIDILNRSNFDFLWGTKVMIFDDNILKFMDCGKTLETGLEDLIQLGFSEMQKVNAKIWSGSDSPNPAHWSADVDVGKGLVYTPYFLSRAREGYPVLQFCTLFDLISRPWLCSLVLNLGFLAQICLFGKVGQRSIQISAIYKLFQTEFGFVQRRKKQMLADKLTSSQLRTNNGPFQLWTCVQRAQSRCTRRHASLPLLTLSQTMQRLSTREQRE